MDKPHIFDASSEDLKALKERLKPQFIFDTYQLQLEDLFLLRNPKHRFDKNYQIQLAHFVDERTVNGSLESCGSWVYFPWSSTLIHYLSHEEHQEVRTGRNQSLITKDEQERFYNFNVGVAGLSVGSHGALTTVLMGGARVIKLADPDFISPTNLNRLRFDFTHIGMNKGEAIARYIYQLNPYAEVTLFTDGITEENIEEFMDGLDILVEELDDIEVKFRMREEAKKRSIPVIMATDSSDNVILDVERYDLNPHQKFFSGALAGMKIEDIKSDRMKMFEAMARIIDLKLVTSRSILTVNEIGKTIYSWPQLASAATASGAVIAYAIRRISLGQPVNEGKSFLNLDKMLDADYGRTQREQRKILKNFMHMMGKRSWYSGFVSVWNGTFWKK